MRGLTALTALVATLGLVACDESTTGDEDAGAVADTGTVEMDSGTVEVDAGTDAGTEPDAGTDAGGGIDAGSEDAGAEDAGPEDAAVIRLDAGSDAGPVDANFDAGPQPIVFPEFDIGGAVGPAVLEATTLNASDSVDPTCVTSILATPDISVLFTPPATAPYTFDTRGSGADTVLFILEGDTAMGAELACNDDIDFRTAEFESEIFGLRLTAGETVSINVQGRGTAGFPFVLNIDQGEANCTDGIDDDMDGDTDCADRDCDEEPTCVELICTDGIDDELDGLTDCDDPDCVLDPSCPKGDIVLLGHDYFSSDTGMETVLWNSVNLATGTGPIDLLIYEEFADTSSPGGEATRMRSIITREGTANGRPVTITALTSSANLSTSLTTDIDVLLIPEQERGSASGLSGLRTSWNADLVAFINRGGVVIVAHSFSAHEWQIVTGPGLITVGDNLSIGGTVSVVPGSTDPVADGVTSYTASSASFRFTGLAGIDTVIQNSGGDPVVAHREFE